MQTFVITTRREGVETQTTILTDCIENAIDQVLMSVQTLDDLLAGVEIELIGAKPASLDALKGA